MGMSVHEIVIVGAGGLGRTVKWLIDRINTDRAAWNIIGFVDDAVTTMPSAYPAVLGEVAFLKSMARPLAVVLALGKSQVRRSVFERISTNRQLYFPTLIDPEAVVSDTTSIGQGVPVFASAVISPDITLDRFVHINQCCSVGHDTMIGEFSTLYPSAVISGNVKIGQECEFGANSCVLQDVTIADRVKVGAGAVVTKTINEEGSTYTGVPARKKI